jgi:hypothetical protein
MRKLSLIFVGVLFLTAVSCRKEIEQLPNPDLITMDDLKVASDFNWKTFENYQLDLTANENGMVSVISEKGTVLQKAYLKQGETYSMKLAVSADQHSVKLLFRGKIAELDLGSGIISYQFQ